MHPVEPDALIAHGAFLQRLARGMLGDEHEAEDVVQEAYAAALRRPTAARTSLGGWLRGTVVNLARRARRGRARRARREEIVARRATFASPADETVARLELQRTVVQAVMGLPEPGRTTLVLRYYDGLGPTEIARRMDCPVRTVESRLRRAHDELRERLDAACGSRRSWVSGFVVLGGGVAMKAKTGVVVAVVALLVGGAVTTGVLLSSPRADEGTAAQPIEASAPTGVTLAGSPTPAKAPERATTPPALAGAGIAGTVLREGKPARAHVEVRPLGGALLEERSLLRPFYAGGPATASADTDAEGRFRIDGLTLGSYQVVARAEDGAVAWERAFCRPREPRYDVQLELVGGTAALEAVARYADGRPFLGHVSIAYQAGARQERWLPEVETDADGRFRKQGIPAGTYLVAFVLLDQWRSTFGVEVPLAPGHVFVVDEGLVALTATVVADDTGEPIAGAEASVAGGRGGMERGHLSAVVSDEKGMLRFSLPAGEPSFWLEKDGFETVQASATLDEPIVLRMKRQGTLTGRVVRAGTREPVAGVPVHGWNWYTYAMKSPLAVSDADGRFTTRAGPGKGMVYALGSGWVTGALSEMADRDLNRTLVEVGQGQTNEVLLEVVPAGRVEGTLLGVEGRAAPGVLVTITQPNGWEGFAHVFNHAEDSSAVTSSDGSFTLENLIPGYPYHVAAIPVEGLPARSEVVQAASGETVRVALRLPAARWLDVRVTELRTGRAVEGATVAVSQSGNHGAHGKTGPDGVVRLEPLLDEPAWLSVQHADYLGGRGLPSGGERLRVPAPGPHPKIYEVTLERGAYVAGRILEADGSTPRAGGQIGVFPAGEPRGHSLGLTGLAQLGREGQFRLGPIPAGAYDVILIDGEESWTSWRQISRWPVATGQGDLVLRVDPALTEKDEDQVVVQVLASDGTPANGFVRVLTGDRVLESMGALLSGRYVCRAVPVGTTAWVEVRGAEAKDVALGSHVSGPLRLDRGVTEVRLPAPTFVGGKVLGPDDAPVAGLLVLAAPTLPAPLPEYDATFAMPGTRTDAKGEFRLPSGDSPVLLFVSAPPPLALVALPPVAPGTTDLVIRLAAGVEAEVTVLDGEGRPVSGAKVEASLGGAPASPRAGTTDARGAVRLRGLARDQAYRLSITPPVDRSDLVAEVEDAWRPAARRATLAPGAPVSGTVRTARGVVSNATLWWRDDGGTWAAATAGVDGTFSVVARAGTEVTLRAARSGSTRMDAAGPVTRAVAGSKDVVVSVGE